MTKLYRLRPESVSTFQGLMDAFNRQHPANKALLAAAAPAALLALPFVAAEAAVFAGVGLLALGVFGLALDADPQEAPVIEYLDEKSAQYLIDQDGNTLAPGVTYAGHPKDGGVVIATHRFQQWLLGQMAADIVAYVRSVAAVRSLNIAVEYDGTLDATVNARWLGGGGGKSTSGKVIFEAKYDKPEIVELGRNLLFIDQFPSLTEGLKSSGKGKYVFRESHSKSISLSASAAKLVGFDASATRDYSVAVTLTI